jgi:hypothetical protein
MTRIFVNTRDLKIWYTIDGMTADAIAEKLTEEQCPDGVRVSGDMVEKLIRDRGIQTRNIRRDNKENVIFVNPDELEASVEPTMAEVSNEIEEASIVDESHTYFPEPTSSN